MTKQLSLIGILLFISHLFALGQGSTYAGPYTTSAPIVWSGISNQTISGLAIKNPNGHSINLTNCNNITIMNCQLGPSKGRAVNLQSCTNITVINCSIESVETGLLAQSSSGLKFNYNDVKNVVGPFPRGQMVQFNEVSGGGNSISYNAIENIAGQSNPEDIVNLYKSSGISNDPIQIIGNWIRGGGPSTSGGGIMTGDNGGSYVTVKDNILVNPGQYGIAIASGNHIIITNNKIFASIKPFNNIGLYVWNQTATDCSSNLVSNNKINYTNKSGELNNLWNAGNCGTIESWSTNLYDPNLNESILPEQIIGRANSKGITTEIETPEKPADSGDKIKIYPNPATNSIKIETSSDIADGTAIIYNLNGQKIIEQQLSNNKTDINTGNFATGVYIVAVKTATKTIEKIKLVISKH